jgi:diguanylate cyclase (GGDEF)-like protein
MVDEIPGLNALAADVVVREVWPAVSRGADHSFLGRIWMRIPRLLISSVALVAVCLAADAQVNSASRPASQASPQTILPRTILLRTGSPHMIQTARAVHSLPPEQAAQASPVRLRAVVTYYDPYIDSRHGALFVHDASGGVFVSVPARPILPIKPGSLVEITGVTAPGDYAAVVNGSRVQLIGQSSLPPDAPSTTLTQLLTGVFDCQWVKVEGRVRSAHVGPNNVVLGIAADGGVLTAITVRQPGIDYESLVDSLVRIDGNAAPLFNLRRQMVGVHLFFPTLSQVTVIQPATRDPFAVPAVPLAELFRFSPDPGLLHRVHVQGTVTLDWPGRVLCIQDAKAGICMQTTQMASVPVGSYVDVVGFPAINLFKPSLEDAVFRTTGAPIASPSPLAISPDQAVKGDLDGRLVRVDAELIGRDVAAANPTVMLRAGGVLFPAILPKDFPLGAALPWKEGSLVRIIGVCNVQVDSLSTTVGEGAVRPESVHILLRSVDDIAVLKAPTWWTSQHALESLSAVCLLVLASFAWIAILRKRVALQTRALRGSEERLRHLSEHDALTGLPNRILLQDRCQTSLKRAVRFKSCLGVLMVDTDEFKIVNDALGHQAGDKLLCELARRLCACVRETDTVARIGGDEFVVLLPDLRIPAEAESIAAKIVAAAAQPYAIDRTQTVITVSVGVVTYPEAGADLESLMRCADTAMYAAKEKGKNSFQVYRASVAATGGGGNSLAHTPHIPLTTGGA